MKCKIIDLCEDILELGVTEITMPNVGLNIVVVDYLENKGIKVKVLRRNK